MLAPCYLVPVREAQQQGTNTALGWVTAKKILGAVLILLPVRAEVKTGDWGNQVLTAGTLELWNTQKKADFSGTGPRLFTIRAVSQSKSVRTSTK